MLPPAQAWFLSLYLILEDHTHRSGRIELKKKQQKINEGRKRWGQQAEEGGNERRRREMDGASDCLMATTSLSVACRGSAVRYILLVVWADVREVCTTAIRDTTGRERFVFVRGFENPPRIFCTSQKSNGLL